MNLAEGWPWLGIGLLGVWHGVNPAMGWLFAVALGLQEDRGRVVWSALGPLALGHAVAIGATLVLVGLVGLFWPLTYLKWIVAAALVGLGVDRLRRSRHPRWGRMRVRGRDLVLWSFLMSSAHGAGLMVLPFELAASPSGSMGMEATAVASVGIVPALATLVHTGGYLFTTGLVAVVVYEKLGLRRLRGAWLNVDLIWAASLILTGLLTPLL